MAEITLTPGALEVDPADLAAVRAEVESFGGEEAIFEQFGLDIEVLAQRVTWVSFEDKPLWNALRGSLKPEAEREPGKDICPLGDMAKKANAKGGTAAVMEEFGTLAKIDPRLKVGLSERTVTWAALKKKQLSQ